jgi:DNA-binding MurR/RpiR family transcriptional regulator
MTGNVTESSAEENRRLTSPRARFGARMQGKSSAESLQARLILQESRNLSNALDRIGEEGSLAKAAAQIVGARRRFVTGSGKSLAYANLLATDLSPGLSRVTLVDGTVVRAIDILSEVQESDVLVAFSFRRYRRETISICEQFAAAGGSVVAITDDETAPIVGIADVTITVPTTSASFTDSPTAVAATIHILSTLTTASSKGARRRLAERDRLSDELGIYFQESQ